MGYRQAAPEKFFNGVIGVAVKLGAGQSGVALQAKEVFLCKDVRAAAFAYVRKEQVQNGFFELGKKHRNLSLNGA